MKTSDLVAVYGTLQAVANLFDPPISRSAVSQWGDTVPELREYQVRERIPNIDDLIAATHPKRRRESRRLSA